MFADREMVALMGRSIYPRRPATLGRTRNDRLNARQQGPGLATASKVAQHASSVPKVLGYLVKGDAKCSHGIHRMLTG